MTGYETLHIPPRESALTLSDWKFEQGPMVLLAPVRLTWRERLLSWPWRPWMAEALKEVKRGVDF